MLQDPNSAIHTLYLITGEPFKGLSLAAILGVVSIYLVTFGIRGAIGFGALAPAVVFSSWLLPPHHAVLLALITATISQIQLLPMGIRYGDWQVSRPIMVAMAITISLGVWLFVRLSTHWFSLVLGIVMSIIVVLDFTKVLHKAASRINIRSFAVSFSLSAIAGLFSGLAGAGGMMMLAVYLKQACRDHVSLRATAALLGTLLVFWRLGAVAVAGLLTRKLITEGIMVLPAVYFGVWLGSRYFRSATPKRYYQLYQFMLLLSAVGLVIKGLSVVLG